jgi:AraC family transcriptional regulator
MIGLAHWSNAHRPTAAATRCRSLEMPTPDQSCGSPEAEAVEREVCPESVASAAIAPANDGRLNGTAAQRELVERAQQYIAAHPDERLRLSQVSDALQVSGPYLTATFREVAGIPLYRYLLRQRLRRALRLLPDEENLARLATDLNFTSHSHFTTAFLRAFGCLPSQVRARARAVCRKLRSRARVD